jgi:phosphatidylglycerol:prolipoprotein diacylglycerol transferase
VTIGLAPTFDVGPVSFAWHGIMTAVGLLVGAGVASWLARRRGLSPDPIWLMTLTIAVAGVAGARLFYLAQADPAGLLTPWSGGLEGFAFYGAVIVGLPVAAVTLRVARQPVLPYLDMLAVGFLAGMVLGRVGDLINGEHYGPPTNLPWGVTYTNPSAHVPAVGVAYHSGALYEIVLVGVLFVGALLVARRNPPAGTLMWSVLGAYALGRFAIFFGVRDVDVVALGLRQAQWTSLGLIGVAALGALLTTGRSGPAGSLGRRDPSGARPGG